MLQKFLQSLTHFVKSVSIHKGSQMHLCHLVHGEDFHFKIPYKAHENNTKALFKFLRKQEKATIAYAELPIKSMQSTWINQLEIRDKRLTSD